jgi:hypothetical protein
MTYNETKNKKIKWVNIVTEQSGRLKESQDNRMENGGEEVR